MALNVRYPHNQSKQTTDGGCLATPKAIAIAAVRGDYRYESALAVGFHVREARQLYP